MKSGPPSARNVSRPLPMDAACYQPRPPSLGPWPPPLSPPLGVPAFCPETASGSFFGCSVSSAPASTCRFRPCFCHGGQPGGFPSIGSVWVAVRQSPLARGSGNQGLLRRLPGSILDGLSSAPRRWGRKQQVRGWEDHEPPSPSTTPGPSPRLGRGPFFLSFTPAADLADLSTPANRPPSWPWPASQTALGAVFENGIANRRPLPGTETHARSKKRWSIVLRSDNTQQPPQRRVAQLPRRSANQGMAHVNSAIGPFSQVFTEKICLLPLRSRPRPPARPRFSAPSRLWRFVASRPTVGAVTAGGRTHPPRGW